MKSTTRPVAGSRTRLQQHLRIEDAVDGGAQQPMGYLQLLSQQAVAVLTVSHSKPP